MRQSLSSAAHLAMLACLLALVACGPATFTRKSYVWEPYDARENRQQRDNVTVELKFVDELPPSFFATVARCDQYGRIVVDKNGKSVISPDRPDTGWIQFLVSNYKWKTDPDGGWRVASSQDIERAPCKAS